MQPAISSPIDAFAPLFGRIDLLGAASIVYFVLFVIWVIYTIVAAYHLLRYGHGLTIAVPALVTHVVVSGLIAIFAVSGLAF